MSKPIIPMHSPDLQRAAVTRCVVFNLGTHRVPSVPVYNGCCGAAISASLQRLVSLRSLSDWQAAPRVESQP